MTKTFPTIDVLAYEIETDAPHWLSEVEPKTRDAGWESEPRKGKGPGGGEWTKGGGGNGSNPPAGGSNPPKLPDKLQTLIDRSDYEVTVEPKTGKWFTPGTSAVTLKPKQPDGWRTSAKGEVYDPKYVTEDPEFGSTALKDREAGEFPGKKVEGSIWRGMSQEEYQQALKQGFFKSLGDYNIGGQQAGLTYFSHDPRQAASYAHGFAPWQYAGTIKQPPVVVRVKDPGGHIDVAGTDPNEVGIGKPVATSAIEEVWQGKPVIIPGGEGEIDPEGKMGNFSVQRPYFVWEKQPAKATVSPIMPLIPAKMEAKQKATAAYSRWLAEEEAKTAGDPNEPPSVRLSKPGLEGSASEPARYQGVGDTEFTGPHAMENAIRTGRLITSADNRHKVEATIKAAGLSLADPTTAPKRVIEAFGLEAYRDGEGKSNLWYSEEPIMAEGLKQALAAIEADGAGAALAKEMRGNVHVMFASYDRAARYAYTGKENAPIAAVWGDKETGQQWLVINTGNTLSDDWFPGPDPNRKANTIGAQNAQALYDAESNAPEPGDFDEIKRKAEALAFHQAMIHEMGHVLDNLSGGQLSANLRKEIETINGMPQDGTFPPSAEVEKIREKTAKWVERNFGTYANSSRWETAAEAWTAIMTRPAAEFPKKLSHWQTAARYIANWGKQEAA